MERDAGLGAATSIPMMRYTCTACRMGQHKLCAGRQPPPPGMFGGSECVCDGKCGERKPRAKSLEEQLGRMHPDFG